MRPSVAIPESFPTRLQLSPGEIHFLWWFIQGSIMNPSTRDRLRKAWGMCERHAWGWMIVEAAFRSAHMHGPAVLYEDVMRLALSAFEIRGPMQIGRLKRRLRSQGPCLMCESGFGPDNQWFVKPEIVRQGRDMTNFIALARRTFPYWRDSVCGDCSGDGSPVRCRMHLMENQSLALADDLSDARALVFKIAHDLMKFARSFQFEFQGTRTIEDAAALISAVGWLTGWRLFLSIVENPATIV